MIYGAIALEQYRDGKFNPAADLFESATKLDPDSVDAWNGLGWANMNSRKGAQGFQSSQDFTRVLALDPTNAMALNGMGWASSRIGQKDDALKYWQRAVDSDPSATSPMSGLAQAALENNDYDEAVKWYERWLKLDPNNADAKSGLEQAKIGQTYTQEALAVATDFFKQLDDEQFADTAKLIGPRASALFHSGSMFAPLRPATQSEEESEKAWADFLKRYRGPLGKTVNRTTKSAQFIPASAPDRSGRQLAVPMQLLGAVNRQRPSALLQFDTKYENKRNATEVLSLQKSPTGEWKIFYFVIQTADVPQDPLKG
jgi:tetratricopeptide (TPR) repeat protein